MPQLKDLKLEQQPKFKKKLYTPWDMSPNSSIIPEPNNLPKDENPVDNVEQEIIKTPNTPELKTYKTKTDTHGAQTKYKQGTNQVQENAPKGTDKVQTRYSQGTKRVQKHPKIGTKLSTENSLYKITGTQKNILFLIAEICKQNLSKTTQPLSIEYIAERVQSNKNTVKISIKRLVIKGLIKRVDYKAGRDGWTIYELPESVYQEIFYNITNSQLGTNLGTLIDSSSSNINTTTKLLDEWNKINFESIKEYGFNEKHILQISKIDSITPDELQDSINYFAFDLLENNKAKDIKKSPVAFFMGILRGQGIYTAPKNYESPQARKLRLKIEQQKAEQEKIEKLETELINTEFNNWRSKLTDDKVEGLLPEEIKNATVAKDRQIRGFLREYFIKTFWDTIKQEKHGDCFS